MRRVKNCNISYKYIRDECQVTISVDMVRMVLCATGLNSKVKETKPKLNGRHIKD